MSEDSHGNKGITGPGDHVGKRPAPGREHEVLHHVELSQGGERRQGPAVVAHDPGRSQGVVQQAACDVPWFDAAQAVSGEVLEPRR
ncbi:MAG: hypothetical protein M3N28_08160 [Actinomycetota bacterium]|nr:hypothetical protein [Actinomycetota bacterium]